MSNLAQRWAKLRIQQRGPRGSKELSGGACSVYREMAALSKDETLAQFNSADTIGKGIGCSARSVKRAWHDLEAADEIVCISNRQGGRAPGRRRSDGSLPGVAPTWQIVIDPAYIRAMQEEQHKKDNPEKRTIYDRVGIYARPFNQKSVDTEANAKQTLSNCLPSKPVEVSGINTLDDLSATAVQAELGQNAPESGIPASTDLEKGDSLSPLNQNKGDRLSSLNPTKGDRLSPDLSKKNLFKKAFSSNAGREPLALRVSANAPVEEGIEQGRVGQTEPSPGASEPASVLVVAGSQFVVAGSTEPNTAAPGLHEEGAEAETPTNLPANNGRSRIKEPPREITVADQIADLTNAIKQLRMLEPDKASPLRVTAEASYAANIDRLRAAETPITGTVLVLQQSQVRSATASVAVEGALGFPAPIVQQDQGIAATAALGPKTGGNWWDPQVTTEQRGVA